MFDKNTNWVDSRYIHNNIYKSKLICRRVELQLYTYDFFQKKIMHICIYHPLSTIKKTSRNACT